MIADYLVKDQDSLLVGTVAKAAAPITACSIKVLDDGGGTVLDTTSLSSSELPVLNTTLSAPVKRGSRVLPLTAFADGDIAIGDDVRIVPADRPPQCFTVWQIDTTNDRLMVHEPAQDDLPQAAPIFGINLKYTVDSAELTSVWSYGTVIWTPTWSSTAQRPVTDVVHCTLDAIPDFVTESDLHELAGHLPAYSKADQNRNRQLKTAFRTMLQDLTSNGVPPHAIRGWFQFARPLSLLWLLQRRHEFGPDACPWNVVKEDYEESLVRAMRLCSRDVNADRVHSPAEQTPWGYEIMRS